MGKSVKNNLILNVINSGTQVLFPLITFPYVCRVIGVEGMGQVDFFNSIISYIYLFTSLGIPLYAIREVARVSDDVKIMNKTVAEIFSLSLCLTLMGYVVVGLLCICVPQIREAHTLFVILSLYLFFSAIGCEWFYQGIEDFKYITIRGICVKLLSVILLFISVRSSSDLLLYGVYCVLGSVGGNIFNFVRLRKYIHKEYLIYDELNIRRHIVPVLKVFVFSLITSFYLKLNPAILGFVSGNSSVGYYGAAVKLVTIMLTLTTCLSQVIMPRASKLIAGNQKEEYAVLVQKSFDCMLLFAIPLSIGLICVAPYAIKVLCGDGFIESVFASQIVAPIVVLVGVSNVIGIQILYPSGDIKDVIISCGIGALINVFLCIVLIPPYAHVGAAIAYLGAELSTTLAMCIISKHKIPIKLKASHFHYILGAILMIPVIAAFNHYSHSGAMTKLLADILMGGIVYGVYLFSVKDSLVLYMYKSIKSVISGILPSCK